MKKSRVGVALLFIVFFIAGFVLLLVALVDSDKDKEGSGLISLFDFGNKVGVITIEGTITSADETLKQLRKYKKRSSIKAILLRINSPGGTVAPAQEIYAEIAKVKKKKPVVVSMETVAASAAYYIASNADEIVCSPGTITGSIGVIMMLPDIQKVINKIGVDVAVIKAGKYKDIGSSFRPLSEEERSILENFAAEVHEQFISDVVAGRKDKADEQLIRSVADGRFFTGQRAKELKLVDTMGNFFDAVKIAAERGGIKGDPELVYPKKRLEGYMDLLTESFVGSVRKAAGTLDAQPQAPVVR